MSPFALFALLLILCALLGALFVINGHLSGIGEGNRALRFPHGKLTRIVVLDTVDQSTFWERIRRLALPVVLITFGLLLLCALSVLSLGGLFATTFDCIAVVAILSALAYGSVGTWRAIGCALAGYIVVGSIACLIAWNLRGTIPWIDTAFANAVTMVFGSFGALCAMALLSPLVRVAREFQDGTVNVIRVAQGSFTYRILIRFEDPEWVPDKDAIARAEALEDVRSLMEKRDHHE